MTSFCRRVIAMRRIVANKKRIASIFAKESRLRAAYRLDSRSQGRRAVTALKL